MSGGGGGGGMSGGSGTASSRRCGCIPPRPSTRGIARHCAMLLGGASWALGSPGVQQRCCGDCATLNHLLNPCGSQTAHPFAPVSVQVRMTKTPPLAMASSSKLLLLFTMLSDCRASWTIDESVQYAQQWKSITSSSDFTKLAAVAFGSNIWTSADSGGTWTEDTSVGARKDWISITSSSDGMKLAAVEGGPAGNGGNIWTSADSGGTWTEDTSVGAIKDWVSITSSSDGTKLAAAVSSGYIWTSADSGGTWTENTSVEKTGWQSITSSSDGTKLAAVNIHGLQGTIWTSADSGGTWTEDTSVGARKDWISITSSSDGMKLAAVEGGPAGNGGNIWTSADSGGTWTEDTSVRAGKHAEWTSITSSSDGTKLAAVVFQGNIWTSEELRPPPPPPPLAPYEGSNNDPLWIAAWVVVVGLMISLLFAGVVKYPWLFKRLLHYLKKMIAKWVERIMRFGTIYTSDPRGNATVAPAA